MKQGRMFGRIKKNLLHSMVLLMMGMGITGCELLGFPEWEWQQKLTVEVETPSGPVSASSVMAVKCGSSPKWLRGIGGGGLGCQVKGEAVPVEIAQGKVLFALLMGERNRGSYLSELALTLFQKDSEHLLRNEKLDRLETLRAKVSIPRNSRKPIFPLLVTFADLNNSKTVQKVDPENLAATFGTGVSLKRMSLEITDERVTEGRLENILKWLIEYQNNEYRLNGKKCIACPVKSNNLSDLLPTSFFKIGDRK